jgi:hypothetical protein
MVGVLDHDVRATELRVTLLHRGEATPASPLTSRARTLDPSCEAIALSL